MSQWRYIIAFLAVMPALAVAATTRPTEQMPVVKLTLHPVAATQPALRYPLLPDVTDQTPGDAAPIYLTAARCLPDTSNSHAADEAIDQWRDMPLPELLAHEAEIRKVLDDRATTFHCIDIAARREQATWGWMVRQEGIATLLPYLGDMRRLCRYVALQARLRIAQKDWSGACRSLQSDFSMAWQLNDHAMLVQALVETGVAQMTLTIVDDWVSQSDAPNLYWTLSALPQPFVDLRATAQWGERSFIIFSFPELAHADLVISAEDCKHTMQELRQLLGGPSDLTRDIGDAFAAAALYPTARQFLLSTGLTKEKVDALTVDQVVFSYFFHQWRCASDEMMKAWPLPYWQGAPIVARATAELVRQRRTLTGNLFLALVPALQTARLQFAKLDRNIALLRTIEALRDYAAKHDGRPPLALDQIVDTPVPLDPITGKSFIYHADGNAAVLEAAIPEGYGPTQAKRYELTFVK